MVFIEDTRQDSVTASGSDMASRKRKGMLIKNTNTYSVEIAMKTREVRLGPGDEALLTADEVLDPELRAKLQIRAVSIVRPATDEEEGGSDGQESDPEVD